MRKMRKTSFILSGFIILSFLFGCASSGSDRSGSDRPSWVMTPPADTSDEVFFVGSGSNPDGDEAAARQAATSDLVASITRFLGVKVSADTTVEAKDTLDSFTTSLEQTIKESSKAQIGDFRIRDTYSEKQGGIANVYILAAYDKESLLQEQARIQAVFAEQREAISGPEAEGDSLASSGSWYRAAVKYLEAALAASSSEVDNAAIKYERNMNKARRAVQAITIVRLNDNLSADMNKPFGEGFRAKVSSEAGALSDVPVKVTYKTLGRNNRTQIQVETVKSGSDGEVEFLPPPPDFVGKETLSMGIDLSDALESLEDVPDALYPQLEALEQLIGTKGVSFSYTVESRAKEVATAVMIVDVDNGGNATGRTETASGLLEALSSQGFKVGTVTPFSNLQGSSDAAVIRNAATSFGNQYGRIIFGTVGISDFREGDGRFTVKVSGDIKVADLSSGDILYSSGTKFKTALGNNAQSAMSAAFKQFGKMIGDSMANSLP
ncbi:hypothetical protein [Sediminispirochaeta smaragdinae]|jgi:hypothetical protein|uniref:Curli production assembly/transport component CsgG n=1 Tax=Sediminispirochaeta smaragdinae (strain DSM 11293 / JCM 15392 / SEBR 4228) TaxID=573413 RepID=E1R920_SEDSS|nr:hypothetical protein [Sediminispirochaeta smaragdinae]ADK82989.1 hypothetical protein Spirs_3904 [Sediminispirochaeta smaragdinae DSM 11293]